jgi:hypothetical protein
MSGCRTAGEPSEHRVRFRARRASLTVIKAAQGGERQADIVPKGGARVNSGPPPDPNALRRDRPQDKDGWTMLPAEGRQGATPKWPLATFTDRELEVWAAIWRTPQAAAWARLGWLHDVALYVRQVVAAEAGSLDDAKEARQWSDRLGLNPSAMLRNRWKVAADETSVRRDQRSAQTTDLRDRMRAISGGAG